MTEPDELENEGFDDEPVEIPPARRTVGESMDLRLTPETRAAMNRTLNRTLEPIREQILRAAKPMLDQVGKQAAEAARPLIEQQNKRIAEAMAPLREQLFASSALESIADATKPKAPGPRPPVQLPRYPGLDADLKLEDSRAARAAEDTLEWTRRIAEAAQDTAQGIRDLGDSAAKADERENKMLFWTKFAAIAAALALVAAVISIIVAL